MSTRTPLYAHRDADLRFLGTDLTYTSCARESKEERERERARERACVW